MPESKSQNIKRIDKFTSLSVFLILFLTGCRELLPYRASTPEVSGILLQNNTPLADVTVYSCLKGRDAKHCGQFKKTTTDSQGHFYFDNVYEIINHFSQLGDSSFSYNINFQYLGRDYHWSGSGGELPDNVNLRCDINQQELCTINAFYQ
jgi:hypothetical protein